MKDFELFLQGPLSLDCWARVEFSKYPSEQEYAKFLEILEILKVRDAEDSSSEEIKKCLPHSLDRDEERCIKCGTKDWMT